MKLSKFAVKNFHRLKGLSKTLEQVRLQKYIADSGFCSRRKAEEMISHNRVKVNGHPAVIGQKVSQADIVTIDGERVARPKKREFIYLMMNKPRGYITTMNDERGRKCVADLLDGGIGARVFPIGRLDVNSEGLLLFTNDGDFANDLMHPSRHVSKTYRVTVHSKVTEDKLVTLAGGVEIDGRKTAPAQVRVLTAEPSRTVLEIIIREGRNRQIRKMCEAVNLDVARLKRTAEGPLRLGMLKPGACRELTREELRAIRTAIKKPEK